MVLNYVKDLVAYTAWANNLALAAAAKLTDEELRRDVGISYKSIFGTLLHMAGAEWVWFERFNGHSPTGPEAWQQWTPEGCADLATLRAQWQQLAAREREFVAGLTKADLQREVSFKRIDGTAMSGLLGPLLFHVVNHATLHRGQVVGMMRQLGHTPPATDLLFYLREQQDKN